MKLSTLFAALAALLLFAGCAGDDGKYIDPRGTDYAGSQSCTQCHPDIAHSATVTAHYKATAKANPQNVLGSFETGKNTFVYDRGFKIVMERRRDSLFQVLYENGKEVRAYPFEVVFGGRNAQTAAYWHDFNTYELPLSYYRAANDWGTSPGFSSTEPFFGRKMIKDCYACHSSNVRSNVLDRPSDQSNFLTQDVANLIDREKVIYGIDCERCHGPSKKHVDYHLKFPDVKTGHDIRSYASLSNQQKLDACSICHSGSDGLKSKSRFEFRMGDKLTDFYRPIAAATVDVHGNQHGMLTQSACFKETKTLNCTSCHDAHANASADLASYSAICSGCHPSPGHSASTMASAKHGSLKENCIDCHMPKQASQAISFQLSKNAALSEYRLRTHKIAVYIDQLDKQ